MSKLKGWCPGFDLGEEMPEKAAEAAHASQSGASGDVEEGGGGWGWGGSVHR